MHRGKPVHVQRAFWLTAAPIEEREHHVARERPRIRRGKATSIHNSRVGERDSEAR